MGQGEAGVTISAAGAALRGALADRRHEVLLSSSPKLFVTAATGQLRSLHLKQSTRNSPHPNGQCPVRGVSAGAVVDMIVEKQHPIFLGQ